LISFRTRWAWFQDGGEGERIPAGPFFKGGRERDEILLRLALLSPKLTAIKLRPRTRRSEARSFPGPGVPAATVVKLLRRADGRASAEREADRRAADDMVIEQQAKRGMKDIFA